MKFIISLALLHLLVAVHSATVGTIVYLGDTTHYTASSVFNIRTSFGGKSIDYTSTVRRSTTTGLTEFPVPTVSSCGGVSQRVYLRHILGRNADGRCTLPTFDINSATETTSPYQYCGTAYYNRKYRHCYKVLFWTRCRDHYACSVASSIRILVLSQNFKYMRLANSGNFRLCGLVPGGDMSKVQAAIPRAKIANA